MPLPKKVYLDADDDKEEPYTEAEQSALNQAVELLTEGGFTAIIGRRPNDHA